MHFSTPRRRVQAQVQDSDNAEGQLAKLASGYALTPNGHGDNAGGQLREMMRGYGLTPNGGPISDGYIHRIRKPGQSLTFTAAQTRVINGAAARIRDGHVITYVDGPAGSGKSTIARAIAARVGGNIAFGAFTGKAASVMRAKGCAGACTLHRLAYRAVGDTDEAPIFVLNKNSPLASADLLVVDEASMVAEDLGADLLSFGKPLLVLGDDAQLPPPFGAGFFTNQRPDFRLTEIHRQAAGSPIISLATTVRTGGRIRYGAQGDGCSVVSRRRFDDNRLLEAGIVLVGANATRRAFNAKIRWMLGRKSQYPEVGDKLVCLRNNFGKGLINGTLWTVEDAGSAIKGRLTLVVRPEDGGEALKVVLDPGKFDGSADDTVADFGSPFDQFAFGCALTVHKAQGSQWRDVVLIDESPCFRQDARRWLYTGITRAVSRLTLVRC